MAEQDGDLSWAELTGFLNPTTRKDILIVALRYIHGLSDVTSAPDWLKDAEHQTVLVDKLIGLLQDKSESDRDLINLILEILINLSVHELARKRIVSDAKFIQFAKSWSRTPPTPTFRVAVFNLLTNLTVHDADLGKLIDQWGEGESKDAQLLAEIPAESSSAGNSEGIREEKRQLTLFLRAVLTDLTAIDGLPKTQVAAGNLLRNLTRSKTVRELILTNQMTPEDKSPETVGLIEPTMFESIYQSIGQGDTDRRTVVTDVLKNMCLDEDVIKELPSLPSFLPALLWPLTGPEEFEDKENDQLPVELQYMTPDKARDDCPEVRRRILETLFQICHVSTGREWLRSNGAYLILREYHKWEPVEDLQSLCEDVVSGLILTESEITG